MIGMRGSEHLYLRHQTSTRELRESEGRQR